MHKSGRTGWGLNAADMAEGVTTVEQMLEKMCPYFARLNELFGEYQNISSSNVSATVPPDVGDNEEKGKTPFASLKDKMDKRPKSLVSESDADDRMSASTNKKSKKDFCTTYTRTQAAGG